MSAWCAVAVGSPVQPCANGCGALGSRARLDWFLKAVAPTTGSQCEVDEQEEARILRLRGDSINIIWV